MRMLPRLLILVLLSLSIYSVAFSCSTSLISWNGGFDYIIGEDFSCSPGSWYCINMDIKSISAGDSYGQVVAQSSWSMPCDFSGRMRIGISTPTNYLGYIRTTFELRNDYGWGQCYGDSVARSCDINLYPPTCPVCPSPSGWSSCINGNQTRTDYYCDSRTAWTYCEQYTENLGCGDPCTGISCNNYCDGSALNYNGHCTAGSCAYSSAICSYGCGNSTCISAGFVQASGSIVNYPFQYKSGNKTEEFSDVSNAMAKLEEFAKSISQNSGVLAGIALAAGSAVATGLYLKGREEVVNVENAINLICPAQPSENNVELSALNKIIMGWGYKIGAVPETIVNFASGLWRSIQNFDFSSAVNNFMQDPFGNIYSGVSGLFNSYINALKNNPIDTLAKTALVAAGLLTVISTGGFSLLPLSAVLAAGGMITIFAQESYEFMNAKNDEELKRLATDDVDDLLWIAGGALDFAMDIKLLNALKWDEKVIAPAAEINKMTNGEFGRATPAAILPKGDSRIIYYEAIDDQRIVLSGSIIRLHEQGETLVERGIIKLPEEIIDDEVLRDAAIDQILEYRGLVSKDELAKIGHNWWEI